MKHLISLLIFMASGQIVQQGVVNIPAPTSGAITWTLAQAAASCDNNTLGTGSSVTYSCTATLGSNDTAGNPIMVIGAAGAATSGTITYAGYTSSETLTQCPASTKGSTFNSGNGYQIITCAYVLSAAGGNKTFALKFTATVGTSAHLYYGTMVFEGHRSTGTATYDGCATGTACETSASGTATRTSPGSACMASGTNDMVFQFLSDTETITSAPSPWNTSPSPLIDNNVALATGWAFGQGSVTAFNWATSGEGSADVGVMACASFR